MIAILQSMRPKQWVKNLFVLAPVVFSATLLEVDHLVRAGLGMLLFCVISGTVYLLNDVFDVEKDRAHPTKKNRPIASGRLPVRTATLAALVLAVGSLSVGFVLDVRFGAVAVGYLVLNLLYSSVLKRIVFLDVISIALGFLLRTLAGAFVIDVIFSEWLFGCTFLLALFLALGKRKHEVVQARNNKGKQRAVLERYKAHWLNYALLVVAGLTIAAYTAYALSVSLPQQPLHATRAPFETPYLPITIPFAVVGIMRFFMLTSQIDTAESPTDRMTRDIPFILNLGAWGLTILLLIYL